MRASILGLLLLLAGAAWPQASQPVVDWANSGALSTSVTVTTSATALPGTALTGRRRLVIYNNDSSTIYVGACSGTTVTTANGLPVTPGAVLALEVGPSATVCGISQSGSLNARTLELK